MSYLYVILALVILIILFIIFKTVLKAFFKLFIYATLIISIISGATGLFVYNDFLDFKEKFPNSDNLFLLEDNGRLLAGFVMHPGGEPSILGTAKINEYNGYYNSKEFSKIIGSNYKVFFIKLNAFPTDGSIEYNGQQISRKIAIDSLKSDTPIQTYLQASADALGVGVSLPSIPDEYIKNNELKTAFFYLLVAEDFGKKPASIVSNIKLGNIVVYPESMMFRVIKFLPLRLVEAAGLAGDNVYKQGLTGMVVRWLEKL